MGRRVFVTIADCLPFLLLKMYQKNALRVLKMKAVAPDLGPKIVQCVCLMMGSEAKLSRN